MLFTRRLRKFLVFTEARPSWNLCDLFEPFHLFRYLDEQ